MADDTKRVAFRALLRILNKLSDTDARTVLAAASLLYIEPPTA